MRERELKLAVGDTFVMPPLVGEELGVAEAHELPELELGTIYHDTSDLRLARNGVTLRYRVGDPGGPVWTLKLPVAGEDASSRDELDFEGGPAFVPSAARSLVAGWVRHAVLLPAAAMSTRRRRWLLTDAEGAELAELAQDEVSVLDGDRVVARFRELEIESRGPELEVLLPIARHLQRAGAVPAAPVPKAVRALGARATAQPDVVPVSARSDSNAGDAVRAAIASAFLCLLAHDPSARLGDAEAVHQMRVATRRLRSDLRTLAPLIDPEWRAGLTDELRWLADLLGRVRDRDVELALLAGLGGDLGPAVEHLEADLRGREAAARTELLTAIASPRYLDLLDRLADAARAPMLADDAQRRARKVLPRLGRRSARQLLKRAASIDAESDDGDYHRVRIAAKRARYAAEAVAPFAGPSARAQRRFASRAAAVQDALGRLQDAVVLEEDARRLLSQREGDASFAFAAGQLVGRLEATRREARAALPRLRKRAARAAADLGAT